MSGKVYWLIVFVLCFSAGPGSAQPLGFEGEVVDSQVVGILGGLDLADLEPGLEITRFENWPLVDNHREPRRSYNFTLIEWRAPRTESRASTRLMICLGRFSTPEELAGAWRAEVHSRSVRGQQLEIGDAARGLYPNTVSFAKNGFVGNLNVSTYVSEDGDLGERLFEQVKDRLFAAIEAQGTPPTPGLDLSFHVLSASDPLVVDVDTGSSPFQHSIGHSVISAVEPHLVSSQGHELLTEENRTVTVSGLSPGDYRLGIDIIDELNRNEEFIYEFTVPDPSSPPDDPTSGSLPASKDATVYERGPHRNEGANPRLLLKKVQGKPAHFVVGFDTPDVNTNGLTKATLVLTIDSSQNVTGWGSGRAIRARRLLTDWAEGNAKSLELPGSQQTNGSGAGATWLSPVDTNIANDQADLAADSAPAWSGGSSAAAPSTAPTVTIKNHQAGEVHFEVTQDLLLGAPYGWLITWDQDVGSQVAFHSREAGAELGPRLLLEYGPGLTRSSSSGFLELVHAFRTRPLATTGYLARRVERGAQAAFSHLASSASSSASSTGSADAPDAGSGTVLSLTSVLLIPEGHPEGPNPELSLRSPHFPQRTALDLALDRVGEAIAGAVAGPHPVLTSLGALTYRAALEAV